SRDAPGIRTAHPLRAAPGRRPGGDGADRQGRRCPHGPPRPAPLRRTDHPRPLNPRLSPRMERLARPRGRLGVREQAIGPEPRPPGGRLLLNHEPQMKIETRTRLDVRPVEPKDRFDLIMGTYESLAPGDGMELIVEHDPLCIYYTLRATREEGTFAFRYLEEGPEIW